MSYPAFQGRQFALFTISVGMLPVRQKTRQVLKEAFLRLSWPKEGSQNILQAFGIDSTDHPSAVYNRYGSSLLRNHQCNRVRSLLKCLEQLGDANPFADQANQ